METKCIELPELRRIEQSDNKAIDQAIADGFRFIGTLHEYACPVPKHHLDIAIRLGTGSDLEACTEMALAELRDSRLYSDETIPFDVAQQEYERRVAWAFENSMILVAELKETIIGFVSLRENRIDLIAVSRDFKRRGVGRQLVEDCFCECAAAGYDTVLVATQGSNYEAHRFYQKMGFERVAIMKDFHG